MQQPIIHTSNSIDVLIMLMRDLLFLSQPKFLAKKMIFLPQLNIKNHLMTRFVSDKKLDVVLGVEFQELRSGIQSLFQMLSDHPPFFPSLDLLTLHIESLLDEDNPAFAISLASEFLKFGKFNGGSLKGWQKELWDKVVQKWDVPYQILCNIPMKKPRISMEVHLFNFPFLPRIYHLFFARVASLVPVHYYQLSPCFEFWSDVITERERHKLIKKYPQMTPYLERGNILLANLGKLCRENFRVFEEEDFILDEHYCSKNGQTALSQMQYEMLHFQESELKQDHSIRFFSASSKLREVELLHHMLLKMNISPSDVQVFAPHISEYAPLIKHVFGAIDSPFDFSIYDLIHNPLIEALFYLFDLGRFDLPSVSRLLSTPYFSQLTKDEAHTFFSWIGKSGVKWGVDIEHRDHLLPGCLEKSESGTWEQAFTHLLNNLIFLPLAHSSWDLPYLDFSDATLLGKAIALIRSLREEVDFLYSAHLTLIKWVEHVDRLFETYFTFFDEDKPLYRAFKNKLNILRELGERHTKVYPFSSIKRYLSSLLKKERGIYISKQLNAVTFRSLKPGSILSSKIIALIGMDEESFPRPYLHSSLSLLESSSDFCPLPSDEDRYLFLEVLLSAQETLILSYQNINSQDGKLQSPSPLIQELDLQEESMPPFSFHHSYFSKSIPYPKHYFNIAKGFYAPKCPTPFIPQFMTYQPLPSPTKEEMKIEVSHLLRFAKHPLRFYCNHVLNLYFSYNDNTDEEFRLSALNKHKLYEQNFNEADLCGHLPLGRFKEVAQRSLEEQPPSQHLEVDLVLKNFHLVGRMEVPLPLTNNLTEQVKYYPLYLLQQSQYALLLLYLHYFQISCRTPSPLHPYLVPSLLKGNAQDLARRLKNPPPFDPYFQALFVDVNPQVIFETWAPFLRTIFEKLL